MVRDCDSCWLANARAFNANEARARAQFQSLLVAGEEDLEQRVSMRATFARMQRARNFRGNPAIVEQPEVPVPVPAGPRDHRSFIWVSSRDAEIYPLVFCVSVGFVIGTLSLARHVMFNPDVNLSRDRRETPAWERYKPEEGKTFSRNRHHLANLKPNPVNQFPEAKTLQEGADEPFSEHL